MKLFKKIIDKIKKNKKQEPTTWYNNMTNNYDPKTGTPNGEAYISPESISIGIANHIANS